MLLLPVLLCVLVDACLVVRAVQEMEFKQMLAFQGPYFPCFQFKCYSVCETWFPYPWGSECKGMWRNFQLCQEAVMLAFLVVPQTSTLSLQLGFQEAQSNFKKFGFYFAKSALSKPVCGSFKYHLFSLSQCGCAGLSSPGTEKSNFQSLQGSIPCV